MATKANVSSLVDDGEERFPLLRELAGIILGVLALILLLALIAYHSEAQWIGRRGLWAATMLELVFGCFVAYVPPVMLGITSFHLLRRAPVADCRGRGWLRGLGGLLILIATCALLTLPAIEAVGGGAAGGSYDRARALTHGGIVGNFIMYPGGLDLGRQLGVVGAALIFGGCALVGLVLFTETFVRDFVAVLWAVLRRLGAWLAKLRPIAAALARFPLPSWAGLRAFLAAPLTAPIAALRRWRPLGALGRFMQGISFQRRHYSSVLGGSGPIRVLESPMGRGAAGGSRLLKGPAPVEDPMTSSGSGGRGARRSTVFNRDGAEHEEPGSRALERPLPEMAKPRPRPRPMPVQPEMELFPTEYSLPSLALLADPPSTRYTMSEAEQEMLSRRIEQTLAQFKVDVEVFEVVQGPVITRFALKVAPGVRVSRILALESELSMAMKAHHVRILAPIPGQSAVGIEVPNKRANSVMLKELLESDEFQAHKSTLAFTLGKNIAGEPIVCDLAAMPHLLIAGATGSGKSVCLNTIIASLLYRNRPDRVRFVMIDPKRVELSIYQAIPHLIAPVVTDTRKAAAALAWCVEQMEERYKRLAEVGVRNIDGYNTLASGAEPSHKTLGNPLPYMPHVVIFIDELADLMMVAKNEVEEYIIRLAQMARAVGMHLVLATQRPSVNVITGIIKANFPSRIAFQVSSKVDSRTILDLNGAEALMGRGDMLYSPGGVKPFRLQGAFVSDAEVERLADAIREQENARYEKEDFETKPTQVERAKAHRGLGEDGDDGEWEDGPENGTASGEGGLGAGGPSGGVRDVSGLCGPGGLTGHLPGGLAMRGRAGEAPLKPCDVEAMSDEELYEMALRLVLESRKASVSYIQRRMKIGYARAGRLMDMMEENGIVGPYQGSKPRDLMVDPTEYLAEE
jgi:hypothetical protein